MTEFSKVKKLWQGFALSPSASDAELAWWRQRRKTVRNWQVLGQGLPIVVVYSLVAVLQGKWWMLLGVPLMGILGGLAFWAMSETRLRNQHITWKRIRDDLGLPDEPGPPERGLMP